MGDRVRVAVLLGGRSSEHAVSVTTASGVLDALDRDRYDVTCVGITRTGRWVPLADDADAFRPHDGRLSEVDDDAPGALAFDLGGAGAAACLRDVRTGEPHADVDVVLPLLHGPWGEDGTVQGLLDLVPVPYVGSGVLASAVAMDKAVAKTLLAAAGLDLPGVVVVRAHDDVDAVAARAEAVGPVWFVKPNRGGSSVGVTRVDRPDGLAAAVTTAREHDPVVLVEQAVDGREVECAVLAGPDGRPRASVPGEVVVREGRFYDYEAKYLDAEGVVDLSVPADLDDATTARVQDVALRAWDALGCEGLARVDVFATPDGRLLVNEVNTMPGFTPVSMYPRLWAASGVEYPALLDRLVADALRRGNRLR